MAYNQDIQLLPQTKRKIDINTPGGNKLLVGGVVILALALAAGFYFRYNVGNIEKELIDLNTKLAANELRRDRAFEKEIQILRKQLNLVSGFLENHVYWTITYRKLESLLEDKVQLTRLDFTRIGDGGGEIAFGGKTTSYSILAKQMAAFLSDSSVEDVELQGAESRSSGLIEFSMKLKIKPSAFHHE